MDNKSVIAEWYKGKSIFITGGTGFMGKVLIEKLLFSCGDLDTLYVLMRPKRGKSVQERLDNMFTIPVSTSKNFFAFNFLHIFIKVPLRIRIKQY